MFIKWLLFGAVLVTFSHQLLEACTDGCWETCFKTFGTENATYRDVYDNVLKIAFEIMAIKDVYKITKLGFLIDSALSNKHNTSNDPFTEDLEDGEMIFDFQINLATILAHIVQGQKNYIVQYNEDSAWTCSGLSCLSSVNGTLDPIGFKSNCLTDSALRKLTLEMNPTSHCPGNVEAGCRLLRYQMNNVVCVSTNSIALVVAIANGDFFMSDPFRERTTVEHEDHLCPRYGVDRNVSSSSSSSSEEHEFYSPCVAHFQHRYVIGTHSATDRIMKFFPSNTGNYRYLQSNQYSYTAVKTLADCLRATSTYVSPCCASNPSSPMTSCLITAGPLGEYISNYPDHPALP